ncbi:Protein AE7-like 1 [Castilleja foliolosa]|uniref:Protein AE7-like 1 n=1 Tax=Castilleja foliolosa TaxID=1961234 RepID=A0ABD3CK48_9LAMI
MTLGLINANPVVHAKKDRVVRTDDSHADDAVDPLDIYEFVRDIRDPEHPYSLEQLSVLSEKSITVDEKLGRILDYFYTDDSTLQHGNSDRFVLKRETEGSFSSTFQDKLTVDIKVAPGSHASEESVNKQLNDKERVAAALENPNIRQLVDECLYASEL